LVDLLAKDLQKKYALETYLTYFLYDSDSNQYDRVKILLSKKAANQYEELTENVYIGKSGYIETSGILGDWSFSGSAISTPESR